MTEVGTWSDGNWTGGGIFYGTVFRFTDGGQGANTHTWPMDVDGRYAVYVRWSAASNRNATADYTVHHAGGTTTITHNQQTDGGVWKPLGVYDLESAETHKVVLADTGAGYTIADAVLLVPMEIESLLVSADAVKLVANDAEDVLTIHADHLGAPQKMTDDTRTVVWDAAFTPFGEEDSIIGAETNHWRFPGQYADDESGLSYNWHRTYDPAIGRYLQSDPIGLGDGLNTYAYVGSNPVSYVDPTGEFIHYVIIGAGTAVLVDMLDQFLDRKRCKAGLDFRRMMFAAATGAVGGPVLGKVWKFAKFGREIKLSDNARIAPFGNRTSHPQGKWPHYHRRGAPDSSGQTPPGQGIKRHRPFETKATDKSFWDRF